MRPAHALPALIALALAGCPKAPAKPVAETETTPRDEWDAIPRTPEWLHATSGFSGNRKEECEEVQRWIAGESACKAALCAHGRDLAKEWLARCSKLAPTGAADVKALSEKFATTAAEPPTDCGKEVESILGGGCGKDATCEMAAQAWGTRCGKAEGTPLIVRALERTVQRKMTDPAEPFTLDTRGCGELRAFVAEGLSCGNQFVCQDMLKRVETYRTRCERDERPTLGTALIEMAITAAAQQTSPPIPVLPTPAKVAAGEMPVPLADMSGAVLMVCNERPTDLAKYLAARRTCEGGTLIAGKGFVRGRELEVRMGKLDFPSDAQVLLRVPSLLAAGERELRDKEELAVLEADLTKAASLTGSGNTLEGAFELFKATMAHVGSIQRSPAFRAAFTARDEALAPALRELARAKVAVSSRGRMPTNDFIVFVSRAAARPFGDFSNEFSVQPGYASRGVTLDTAPFMPKATEAYLDVLKAVIKEAARKKLDPKLLHDTTVQGYEDAKVCGAAQTSYREAEQALIKCAFGVEACDAARLEALTKANDEARNTAERAYLALHLAMTGPAASAKEEIEQQAMLARECNAPWWW